MGGKVMVWGALFTSKPFVKLGAAKYSALPGWLATIMTRPVLEKERLVTLTITPGPLVTENPTGKPTLDVAAKPTLLV